MANIKLNNNSYPIPDSKLAGPTADFVAHLSTIAGNGIKVVIGGVEYGVDATKVAGAVSDLNAILNGLQSGNSGSTESFTYGLYQTGAIALYEEQGAEAIEGMLIKSWDDMVADGELEIIDNYREEDTDGYVAVKAGTIMPELPEKNEYGFYFGVPYAIGTFMNVTFFADGSCDAQFFGENSNVPANSVIYSIGMADMTAVDMGIIQFSEDGMSFTQSDDPSAIFAIGQTAQLSGDLFIPNVGDAVASGGFAGQFYLTGVNIAEGIKFIDEAAFALSALTDVVIPSSIQVLHNQCFKSNDITNLTFSEGEHMMFTADEVFADNVKLSIVRLPDFGEFHGIVGDRMFWNCHNLKEVYVGKNTSTICYETFLNCIELTKISINKEMTEINGEAFRNCTSLTDIIYEGTSSEWQQIGKGENWNSDIPATHVHCTDGDVAL